MLTVVRLAFTLMLLASFAAAQQQPWVGAPFSADPAELLQAASTIPPAKYPHATILFEEVEFHIDTMKRITRTRRLVYRVDSPKAVSGWGKTSVYWEPWHQERPEIRARVVTADGTVYWLDSNTLSDSPTRQPSPDVFSDTRSYGGPLPGVAAGAIIEEFHRRVDTAPFFEAGTAVRYTFGSGVEVHHTRMVIDHPADMTLNLKIRNLDQLKQTRSLAEGRLRLLFEHGRLPALKSLPPLLPPDAFLRPTIEFATASSWKAVNQGYHRTIAEKFRTEDVLPLVKSIPTGADRAQTLLRIVARLHQEVRYTGIEFGDAKIIPQFPASTLARKYGDCKDKATLLVSMLRAASIPAHLALVRAGYPDVDQDVPGLGLFDHAIVYVPGQPAAWIDATAEFNPPGNVPTSLQGKQALVIDGKSDHLVRIPFNAPTDNLLKETREIYLADYGPARVVETAEASGFFESGYRSYFSGPDSKQKKEALERYGKSMYSADTLAARETSDGRDLLTPFRMRLEYMQARRGATDLDEAVAAVRTEGLYSRMPAWFRTAPTEKKSGQGEEEEPQPARTADFVFTPFIVEWRYKFIPPLGFHPRSLPPDSERSFGPATLTQNWEAAPDGVVLATLRFNTVKGRYTVAEAEAARDAFVQAAKDGAIIVPFDNLGSALLAKGQIREGLAEYERVAAREPTQALHRVRISRALLQAGLGEGARKQAEIAVRLDPKSPHVHRNLGWILEHDLLGRRFAPGFDPDQSVVAYLKAAELDPQDVHASTAAAIVMEHAPSGERYAPEARLQEAVRQYAALKAVNKNQFEEYEVNQLFCMFYSGAHLQLLEQIGNRAHQERFRPLTVAATAAAQGVEAAIQHAGRITESQQSRNQALISASNLLLRLRRYPDAAALIAAGLPGQQNTTQLRAQMDLYRSTRLSEELRPATSDPSAVLHDLLLAAVKRAPFEDVMSLFSRSYVGSTPSELRRIRIGIWRAIIFSAVGSRDLPAAVTADLVLSNTRFHAEGDELTGYRVRIQLPDVDTRTAFVVREDGNFRILALDDARPLGHEALLRLEAGSEPAAIQLLDWARDEVERQGSDDPLQGPLFTRLWEKRRTAHRPPLPAAVALAADSGEADLSAFAQRAAAELPLDNLPDRDLLLFAAYASGKQWTEALAVAARLYAGHRDSETAFLAVALARTRLQQFKELESEARARHQRFPDEDSAFMVLAQALSAQNRFQETRALLRTRIDSGKADANVLNNYAWDALFTTVDDEALEVARRGVSLTSQREYSVLHTLASLYAEVGRLVEAREVMLQAMDSLFLDELDSALWYVYGRIAEHYGQDDLAQAAYARVTRDDDLSIEATSTYALANRRLTEIAKRKKENTTSSAAVTDE